MSASAFKLRRRGLPFKSRQGPSGFAETAAWLARDVLWVGGWLSTAPGPVRSLLLEVDGTERQVEALQFAYPRRDLDAASSGAHGEILLVPFAGAEAAEIDALDAVYVLDGESWYRWTLRRGLPVRDDLRPWLPGVLTPMPEEARRELRAFVCERCPESLELDAEDATWRRNRATLERLLPDGREEGEQPADDEAAALAQADDRTKEVEEGEESRPIIGYGEPVEPWFWQDPAPANPGHRLTLCVDRLLALDTESVFVSGWIWDADRVLEAIDLVSPDGTRSPVLDRIAWLPRPDVSESLRGALGPRAEGRLGLISLVPLAGPLVTRDPYRIDVRLTGGRSVVLGAPPLTVDPIIARGELLRSLPEERYLDVRLIEEQVAPALERLQPRASEQASPDRIVELGPPPVSPAISMVIPLSRRFDLLEHQLAWIAGDAGLRECEIVYVIDADGLESHRVELWSALSRLYDVSLRLVVLSRNVGYAAAVNLGSQQARGRLLLLLHSDVLVERPGWARRLAEHYDASPEVGILAPKLLYEDGSIQQAGLTFDRTVHEVWSMKHRLGGLPRRHPAAAEARQVAAASGACLMIERSLFERVGGLRDRFIAGDLEDVDLCLRSQVEGRSTWYRPEAELYHLGGLSRSVERGWARNPWACLYNDWLLTRLWGERIEDMVDRFGS